MEFPIVRSGIRSHAGRRLREVSLGPSRSRLRVTTTSGTPHSIRAASNLTVSHASPDATRQLVRVGVVAMIVQLPVGPT